MQGTWYWSGIQILNECHSGDVYGEVDAVVGVVGGQGPKIKWEQGYSPVKLKTECDTLGIGLVFKLLVGGAVGICRVRWI